MPDRGITQLLQMLDEGYSKAAWHGPNLRGSIRGLTAREAAWRPGRGRHNIWEIVVHAAYWKYAVRRRLLGEKRGMFAYEGRNWFALPEEASEAAWTRDVALLTAEHKKLRAVVAAFPPSSLNRPSRGHRQIARWQIEGIAFHDVYHAGQIQLLKRLMKNGKRR